MTSGLKRSTDDQPSTGRRRVVFSLTLLLLGIVGLGQTSFRYLPRAQAPELRVELDLSDAQDIEQLTETHLVPIEAAIRSIGGVEEIVGTVGSVGSSLRVRLEPGADPESKAARLESELAILRRSTLPEGSSLRVIPGQLSFDVSLVLWLRQTGVGHHSLSADRFRSGIESLPGVRNVAHLGEATETLTVRPRASGATVEDIRSRIARALSPRSFGRVDQGPKREILVEKPFTSSLDELAMVNRDTREASDAAARLSTLASQSTSTWQAEEPERKARFQGAPGQAFLVFGEADSTPIALRREVDEYLHSASLEDSVEIVFDRSTPLRQLLARIAVAFLVGTLLCFIFGWWLGALRVGACWALVLPLSIASGINALLISGLELDVTTLPMFVLGQSVAPLLYALRSVAGSTPARIAATLATFALAATTPLLTASLLAGATGPLLATPARVLLVTVSAALLAALIPPRTTLRAPVGAVAANVFCLRNGPAIVLVGMVFTYFSLAVGGKALEPVAGAIDPPLADLVIDGRFGDATPVGEVESRLSAIERHLDDIDEVKSYWSEWQRGRGSITVEVSKQARERKKLFILARQLEFQLTTVPGAVTVRALGGLGGTNSAVDLSGRLGSRPETDEDALAYRFVLRSTRLADLEEARARIASRFAQQRIRPNELLSDWGTSQPVVRLEPRPDQTRASIDLGIAALRRASLFSRATTFPGERRLGYRVISEIGPKDERTLPDPSILSAALPVPGGSAAWRQESRASSAVSASNLFTHERVLVPPTVLREDGRFALPLTLRMRFNESARVEIRDWVHSTLGSLGLPSSIDIERPEYHRWAFTQRRLEVVRAFGVLPLLLFVLAAIRTDSIVTGLIATFAPLAAVAGTAITLQFASASATELTYLTLGSTLTLVLPMAVVVSLVALERRESPSNLEAWYRFASQNGSSLLLAVVVASVVPVVVQINATADIDPWVLPMRAAASSTAIGLVSALVIVPLLVLGRNRLARFDRRAAEGHARPSLWTSRDLAPRLSVENLTRVYPHRQLTLGKNASAAKSARTKVDGFHALHRLDFDLEPGIVGLLGPNGAGKTTLLRILCGVLEPTRGRVRFHGIAIEPLNLAHYRNHIGFLPQGFNAYRNTSARAFLDYWALERGLLDESMRKREISRVLELVGLSQDAERNVREFSGGMRRRIGIARALLGDPPILIVDEPTTGLDVESRNRLRNSLLAVAENRIVVFSTHIASDLAAAARRILVLDEGQLLFDGTASALIERGRGRVFELLVDDRQMREVSLGYRVTTRVRTAHGIRLHLVLAEGQSAPPGCRPLAPSVEEAYLAIMDDRGRSSDHAGYARLLDLESG